MDGLMKVLTIDGDEDIVYLNSALTLGTYLNDNGKIEKSLRMNYIACSQLVKYSEVFTGFSCNISGDDLCVGTYKELIIIAPTTCCIYNFTREETPTSKYITEESYKRIKALCTNLVNKFKV